MFEPQDGPRLFHLPPGCDFAGRFLDGLAKRLAPLGPIQRARVRVIVNTRRAARVLEDRMVRDARFDGLLPRIEVLGDLADRSAQPAAIPDVRRMFWLARLVDGLLRAEPDLAPRSARFDLARALGGLLDELQEAGLSPEELSALDVAGLAEHWQTSLRFVDLLVRAWPEMRAQEEAGMLDAAERTRLAQIALLDQWRETPPKDPIIIAGSTGSRVGTQALMRAVAQLPQGAVVLPGYDAHLPDRIVADRKIAADHPQFGLRQVINQLDVTQPQLWAASVEDNARQRLVSVALRPAPVTDEWLALAPSLQPEIATALNGFSWLDAPGPREEAEAIAFAMREAVEQGHTVALVTPDRSVSRRVASALDRWRIVPDDSAGRPLHLTPPGVLMRLLGRHLGQEMTPSGLIELLKHPLVGGDGKTRNAHLRRVGGLQTDRDVLATATVDWALLREWAGARRDAETRDWVGWLQTALAPLAEGGAGDCAAGLDALRATAEALSLPYDNGSSPLWQERAGEEALRSFEAVRTACEMAGPMSDAEIASVLEAEFSTTPVREEGFLARPGVSILGALEARMQHADLIILGGLNEATWPARPSPDPWMNREMRARLGLPLPEREIGLAAHDFQMAATAPDVLVTRSVRVDGAPTVASRWLIRLENLVKGLGPSGEHALSSARARGARLLGEAHALDRPTQPWPVPARREAPAPPFKARPRELAVTRVEALIRDPYAIYAQKVLGLYPLSGAGQEADARLRGTVLHKIMERWAEWVKQNPAGDARAALEEISLCMHAALVPWATAQVLWHARLMQIADPLCEHELARQSDAHPIRYEIEGRWTFDDINFTLTARADRFDLTDDQRYRIYDYKSGDPPSEKQIAAFAQQLPLTKLIAERGGFTGIGRRPVAQVAYLGLNRATKIVALDDGSPELAEVAARFPALIHAYDDPAKGYSPRSRPAFMKDYETTYDLVSRYGEWGDEVEAVTVEVGR
ncbi:double-strand break repair protein AddB [Pontivivens insulae]|nr:double-strand break repair protein AddB [Pontivivens insulae]